MNNENSQFGSDCQVVSHSVYTLHIDLYFSVSENSQLLSIGVLPISDKKCRAPQVYGDRLDDSMFCAGSLHRGIDSSKVRFMYVKKSCK